MIFVALLIWTYYNVEYVTMFIIIIIIAIIIVNVKYLIKWNDIQAEGAQTAIVCSWGSKKLINKHADIQRKLKQSALKLPLLRGAS